MNYYDEELQELLQQTMREKRLRAKAVFFYRLSGKMEEKMSKEKEEAYSAAVKNMTLL